LNYFVVRRGRINCLLSEGESVGIVCLAAAKTNRDKSSWSYSDYTSKPRPWFFFFQWMDDCPQNQP